MTGCGVSSDIGATGAAGVCAAGSGVNAFGRRRFGPGSFTPLALVISWFLIATVTLLSGCAGVRRGDRPPEPPLSRQPLPGSDRVYPSQDPGNRALPGAPEAFPDPAVSRTDAGEAGCTALYEVQLFASGSARDAREKALEIAERMQVPVRVIRDKGLHVVRACDSCDRAEAGSMQSLAIDLGYRDAWVVPMSPGP